MRSLTKLASGSGKRLEAPRDRRGTYGGRTLHAGAGHVGGCNQYAEERKPEKQKRRKHGHKNRNRIDGPHMALKMPNHFFRRRVCV